MQGSLTRTLSDTEDPWQLFKQQRTSSSKSFTVTSRRPAPVRNNSFYHATSSSLRSLTASELGQALSMSVCSDWEALDECPQGPRRICLAKLLLAEASSSYSNCSAPAVSKLTAKCPAGALGPLLSMLSDPECIDAGKLCSLLDTLALLLMDAGNMSIARDLNAMDVMFGLLRRVPHSKLLNSAMPVFTIMTKAVPNGRVLLWNHPNLDALLSLITASATPPESVCSTLRSCRLLLFSAERHLLAPAMLLTCAQLLQPHATTAVLLKALKLLGQAACAPGTQDLPGWSAVVVKLVSLLEEGCEGRDCVVEAVLQLLMTLAEHPALKSSPAAASCIPTLVSLLHSKAGSNSGRWAACLLSGLAEADACCSRLCSRSFIGPMLAVLQGNICVETTIAVLYTLGRIATHSPAMLLQFKHRGAVALLQRLLTKVDDEDAVLGTLSLLESLSATTPPNSTSPEPGNSSTDVSPTRHARGEIDWERKSHHGTHHSQGARANGTGKLRKAVSALLLCEEQRHYSLQQRDCQGSGRHHYVEA